MKKTNGLMGKQVRLIRDCHYFDSHGLATDENVFKKGTRGIITMEYRDSIKVCFENKTKIMFTKDGNIEEYFGTTEELLRNDIDKKLKNILKWEGR